jgi:hypothetical protein
VRYNGHGILQVINMKEEERFEDLGVDGKIILK